MTSKLKYYILDLVLNLLDIIIRTIKKVIKKKFCKIIKKYAYTKNLI